MMISADPCDGCHDARRAAITAAKAAVAGAQECVRECEMRIEICEDITGFTQMLATRLRHALARLRAVPADLGETYESV